MAIGEGNAGDPRFDTEESRTSFCLLMLSERRIISRYLKKHDWNHASLVMLLELYIADAADRPLSVSSLGYASGVSLPTATRLAVALETQQLVDRERDPLDGRRINVTLAARGRATMRCILDDCANQRASTRGTLIAALVALDRALNIRVITPGPLPDVAWSCRKDRHAHRHFAPSRP